MNQLKEEWTRHTISPDTRVYFSFGEREIADRESALDDVGYFNDCLVAIGGTSYIHIQKNGGHNEMTWRQQDQGLRQKTSPPLFTLPEPPATQRAAS